MTAAASTLHERALAIAGATPAFRATSAEDRELRDHLRGCPDCARRVARMRADLDAIGRVDPAVSPRLHDKIREVAVAPRRSGPGLAGLLLVFLLLSIGTMGAALGVGALQARPAGPVPPAGIAGDPRPDAVTWNGELAAVSAKGFALEVSGRTFTQTDALIASGVDPEDPSLPTLEVTWTDQGLEQRLTFAFVADDDSWSVGRVTLHDLSTVARSDREREVLAQGVVLTGEPLPAMPLGQAFEGDVDLAVDGASGPVRLRLDDARIELAAVRPANIGPGLKPPQAGDELACTGILQLSPLEADLRLKALGYRVDWRWQWATGPNTGQSEVRGEAPLEGFISGTAPGPAGTIVVFVEDPTNPLMPRAERPATCLLP